MRLIEAIIKIGIGLVLTLIGIDADALKKMLNRVYEQVYELDEGVEEPDRKTGKWILTEEFHGYDDEVREKAAACSVCKVAFKLSDWGVLDDFRYCPNCGARMTEEC